MQLNLKRNYGYPLLQCENPHPPRTSLFPDYLFQSMNAHSLGPGNGKPLFTAWSIPLISALLWAKIFPYGSFPSHPVSQRVFTQNYKELKNPEHTPAPQQWEGTTVSVSTHIFKFDLALKNNNSVRRKCHCWDLPGVNYIWNKWLRFPSPTLLF